MFSNFCHVFRFLRFFACFDFCLKSPFVFFSDFHLFTCFGNVFNQVTLSAEDKAWLLPFTDSLTAIEVYEMGKIKKIVDSIEDTDKPHVQQWKELVLEATFSMNQTLYDELMQLTGGKKNL